MARFVRSSEDPRVAEVAVVATWQGRGLGDTRVCHRDAGVVELQIELPG